jgi:hypothetical protein
LSPRESSLFIEGEDAPSKQRLRTLRTAEPSVELIGFLPGGFSSTPLRISANVSDAMNRSSSDCSAIQAISDSDGAGLVKLLMMLVSSR